MIGSSGARLYSFLDVESHITNLNILVNVEVIVLLLSLLLGSVEGVLHEVLVLEVGVVSDSVVWVNEVLVLKVESVKESVLVLEGGVVGDSVVWVDEVLVLKVVSSSLDPWLVLHLDLEAHWSSHLESKVLEVSVVLSVPDSGLVLKVRVS